MIKKALKICFMLMFIVPLTSHAEDTLKNKSFSFKGDSNYSGDRINLGLGGEYKTRGLTFDGMAYSSSKATVKDFKSNALSINKVNLGVRNYIAIYKDVLFLDTSLKFYIDTRTNLVVSSQNLEVIYYF